MSNNNNHSRRPNILWPAILIIVGLAFLFQNLGLIGTDIWDNVFKFWPVLLILLGINDMVQNRGIVGPTMLISIGSVFMASNLGYLGWDSWMTFWRLWPVIIIAVGLEIFLGRKNIILSMFGVALSLALLAGGLYLSGGISGVDSRIASSDVVTREEIVQSIDGAESAEIRIDSSVGKLSIEALDDSANLIEGTIYTVNREAVIEDYEMNDDVIEYHLYSEWAPGASMNFNDSNARLAWNLDLTDNIPLDLDISLGVGKSTVDLSELQVTDLDLSIGVGQTEVSLPAGEYRADVDGGVGQTILELPDEGQIKLNVDGGVGEIVIYLPEDMAAKINVDRGIAGLSVPSGFDKNEDTYTSSNYSNADNFVEITVDQGIGNIAIRRK